MTTSQGSETAANRLQLTLESADIGVIPKYVHFLTYQNERIVYVDSFMPDELVTSWIVANRSAGE